jgi:uncharacterized protein (TIGR02001 family)
MRTFIGCTVSLLAIAVASPALAQDTAPPEAITINGGATVVTDYRFRGISQTNKNFAVQGSLTVTHETGLYVSVWGSSIDDYVANGSNQEIDLIAGYKKTVGGTTFDVGALYYFYPQSQKYNGFFSDPTIKYNSDFVEPYVAISHTFGPVTAKVAANYAPKQKALGLFTGGDDDTDPVFHKKDNLYTSLDLNAVVAQGFGVSAHIGHNWMRSFLSADKRYTDWAGGVTYTYKQITFGVSYVDTDFHRDQLNNGFINVIAGKGKDIAKGGVVGSVGVSF